MNAHYIMQNQIENITSDICLYSILLGFLLEKNFWAKKHSIVFIVLSFFWNMLGGNNVFGEGKSRSEKGAPPCPVWQKVSFTGLADSIINIFSDMLRSGHLIRFSNT